MRAFGMKDRAHVSKLLFIVVKLKDITAHRATHMTKYCTVNYELSIVKIKCPSYKEN